MKILILTFPVRKSGTHEVATDIGLDATYIGASQQYIDALLCHPALEAVPAEYRASVAMAADTINLGDPI